MKYKVLNILYLLVLVMFASCNNILPDIPNEDFEYTITIVHDKTLETLDTVKIKNSNYFYLSDLPKYYDDDYYFYGLSINNDNDYIDIFDECEINSDIIIYAKFGIFKTIFDVGDIGKVEITTANAITSKETYVDCMVSISDESYSLKETNARIRLRGNSSLDVDKKSYKLKFNEKYDIFNFGKDKEWALIANYFDPSHLRNFYAYRLASAMEMQYSVDCKFVEVYLNSVYQGLYLFVETVKTSKNRVDIECEYDSSSIEIPFLLELDFKISENNPNYLENLDKDFFILDNYPYNGKVYQFATKYPKSFTSDYITSAQYEYIKGYIKNVYSSLRDKTYEKYIDVDSFIDYYIIQELFMNIDLDYSSVFMYKPINDKLHMGPVWDFDISTGNCRYVDNYDPYHKMSEINTGSYILNTLLEDQKFRAKFLTRLNELESIVLQYMFSSFKSNLNILSKYADKDNNVWENLNQPNWVRPDQLINLTFTEQVEYLENYLYEHYHWMKKNM